VLTRVNHRVLKRIVEPFKYLAHPNEIRPDARDRHDVSVLGFPF
jgi:hypothetical protein